MLPNVGIGIVDVSDIARMHSRALTIPAAVGKRIIGAAEFMQLTDIAETLRGVYPERSIPTKTAPDFIIRLIGIFNRTIRSIIPLLGRTQALENTRAQELLNIDFIPGADSVRAAAHYIIDRGLAD